MKRKEDFIDAIGPADADFVASIHHTLTELQQREDERPVKKFSVSLGVVLAIVLIAAIAVAAAAQWGIFDFIDNRHNQGPVLPEATELLQQDIAQEGGVTGMASFELREAVLDGRSLFMVVAVHPLDAETMLLGTDTMPSDGIINMGPLFAGETATIADWAERNGRTRLVHTNIYDETGRTDGEPLISSLDYILEEDGTLVYMLNGTCETAEPTVAIELVCSTMPWVKDGGEDSLDETRRERASLRFTLDAPQITNVATYDTPTVFADCGVRVDRVTLSGTAMSTHAHVEFTVIDADAYALTDGGLWFEFLDGNGERLPSGSVGSGSISAVEGTDGKQMVQEDDLAAMETLPETIILRGYNAWEKNRYETHEMTSTK
ncbi:hypothetical protein LJC74_07500 [Eubacteriales bacterium OttesenSCG-928-A19]|nr:hypothetical protein [Eubacteriales bacterium OttesenSCG-928-A19]